MVDDRSLQNIRLRAQAVQLITAWSSLPAERRNLVLAELEETARSTSDAQFASDITIALDALDAAAALPGAFSSSELASDVRLLLEVIDRAKAG